MAKTVLVVDDSSSIRQSVSFVLEENGYAVKTADDGSRGLDALGQGNIDLVITDVNMPEMNGIDMVKQMKTMDEYRFTPVLILTTESQQSIIEEGKAAGASGWMVKPFTNEKLISTVKKVLG